MGVTRTQVVKFIRKGDPGDKGEQGAALRGPQMWKDCAAGYAFQAGATAQQWKDVVIYNDNYYSCVKAHTKTASNYPGSTADANNHYWQLSDKIEIVAANILLAQYALIKNLGVETIDMRDAAGNILFQAKDGNVTCNTGTFQNCVLEGYLQTKFTDMSDKGDFTISDILNISTFGGWGTQVIYLPHDASFIGKRVCIANTNYPPYTKTSLGFCTTIRIDDVLRKNYIGIGGNIDIDASLEDYPANIDSIDIRGGVVELLAVPEYAHSDEYCRWIVLNGKHSILSFTKMQ